jgi:hypothetical protein
VTKTTTAILIMLCLLVGITSAYAGQAFVFKGTGTGQIGGAFGLIGATQRITILEKDKAHAITPAQASKALKLLRPLRSMPKLTASQANSALTKLNGILTPAQVKAANALMAENTQAMKKVGGSKPGTSTFTVRSTSANGVVTKTTTSGGGRVFVPAGGASVIMTRNGNSVVALDFNPFYTKPSPTGLPTKTMVKSMDAFFSLLEHRAKNK